MSLDGGFDEFDESFRDRAKAASNAAIRRSCSATRSSSCLASATSPSRESSCRGTSSMHNNYRPACRETAVVPPGRERLPRLAKAPRVLRWACVTHGL